MQDATNDNKDPFETLAAVTARVLAKYEKQNADADTNGGPKQTDEEKAEQHRKYVETRLREIAKFERRASGGKKV
jgi:cell pole-organizing protein PopZ